MMLTWTSVESVKAQSDSPYPTRQDQISPPYYEAGKGSLHLVQGQVLTYVCAPAVLVQVPTLVLVKLVLYHPNALVNAHHQ